MNFKSENHHTNLRDSFNKRESKGRNGVYHGKIKRKQNSHTAPAYRSSLFFLEIHMSPDGPGSRGRAMYQYVFPFLIKYGKK